MDTPIIMALFLIALVVLGYKYLYDRGTLRIRMNTLSHHAGSFASVVGKDIKFLNETIKGVISVLETQTKTISEILSTSKQQDKNQRHFDKRMRVLEMTQNYPTILPPHTKIKRRSFDTHSRFQYRADLQRFRNQ